MATNQQQQNEKEQEKNSSSLFQKIDLLSSSKKEDISTTEAKSNMSSNWNKYESQKQKIINTPEFLDLMWNIIDNSIHLKDAKYLIRKKFPFLLPFTTDEVIDRSARLYHLSKTLKLRLKRRKNKTLYLM